MKSSFVELTQAEINDVTGGIEVLGTEFSPIEVPKVLLARLDTLAAIAISGLAVLLAPSDLGVGYKALISMGTLTLSYIVVPTVSYFVRPAPPSEKEIIKKCTN